MRDLICISHLRWDFVWQRPQHVLSRLAKEYRLFFVEEPLTSTEATQPHLDIYTWQDRVTVIRLVVPAAENYWIGHGDPLTQALYSQLLHDYFQTKRVKAPVVWLYTPMAYAFVASLQPEVLVYDVMDQLSAFKGAPPEIHQREKTVLQAAEVVFTGGVSLYRSKLAFNNNTHLLPSGVEIEHFAQAACRSALPCPDELAALAHPILGYFGVIDERTDLEVLAYLAEARPDCNIILIGPVVKIDPNDLPQAANMHYLGMRSYEQLPAYLAHFDVALIPFAMNEATRYLSPTKTLEYMAAHKPIVSTPIYDVIELYGEVVHVGYTPEEFVRQIEVALNENAAARQDRESELLAEHTWDAIAERMSRLIRNQFAPRQQAWRGFKQADPSLFSSSPETHHTDLE